MRSLCCLFLSLLSVWASPAVERHPLTPQDLWAMKRLSAPAISPDGKSAVVVVQDWSVEKNKSSSNLWLVDISSGATRRLTTAKASDNSPVWSPDGRSIAFISKRGEDATGSLYLIPVDGGEAVKIVELPYAVSNPKWLPDGKSLIVATTVIPSLSGQFSKADQAAMKAEIKRRKDSKISARVSEDRSFRYWDSWITDKTAQHLVRIDISTTAVTDLMAGFDRPFELGGGVGYDISPDGASVVIMLNSTPPPYRDDLNNDVYLLPTDGSGKLVNLTPENPSDDDAPKFAPDGRTIVYVHHAIPYEAGESGRLWQHDVLTKKNTPLSSKLDYSFGSVNFSRDSSTLWFAAEERGRVPLFRMRPDGTGFTSVYSEGASSSLSLAANTAVFLNNTASRPDELFSLDLSTGQVRQLTHFNEELLSHIEFGKMEEYWFEGAGGDKVMGLVFFPPNFDTTKTYSLVQLMHGGPHTMISNSWSYRWNAHAFAAAGHVVTWVNRHGSTGFGESFAMSILNHWGEKPLEDILKSTDYLLAKYPNIDPKRLAAAGGSYGGYMAAWVAGHSQRFACLIDHAGVNDFVTQYGADVTSYGFTRVLGGTPWQNPEGMQRNNPMAYAANFKTPMLIIHGELDYRVPYVNGTALYGVYQAMGLPSRLVVFPDENHWILSPQNSLRWNYEVQTWLARYIGGTPTLKEPRFDE